MSDDTATTTDTIQRLGVEAFNVGEQLRRIDETRDRLLSDLDRLDDQEAEVERSYQRLVGAIRALQQATSDEGDATAEPPPHPKGGAR